jgi:hypothetical protein
MKEQLDRLEIKLDKLSATVGNHLLSAEKRMCRLEVIQKAFVWAIGSTGILCLGYFLKLFR